MATTIYRKKITLKPVFLLYILAIIIPFSQSIPAVNIAGRDMHIGFDTVAIYIILTVYVTRMLIDQKQIIVFDRASKLLFAWWCWVLIMVLFSIVSGSRNQAIDAVIVFLRWSQYIPVFFVIINMKISVKQLKVIIAICLVASLLINLSNIIEFFVGINYSVDRGASLIMRSMFIENAQRNYNISAAYLAVVTLVLIPLFFKRHSSILVWLFLLFSGFGIFVTSSRSGFIALIIGILFLGLKKYHRQLLFSLLVIFPLLLSVFWYFHDTHLIRNLLKFRYLPQALPLLFGADLQSLGLPEIAGGGVYRLFLWGESFRYFIQSPLFGHGYRATRWSEGIYRYFTADNYYLEMLSDTGIIGIAFLFFFLFHLYKSAKMLSKYSTDHFIANFALGYQAAFIALLFINMTAGMFMAQRIWGTFILFSALLCNQLHSLQIWIRNTSNFDLRR